VDVSPGAAGSWVQCTCGRKLSVPTLQELRRLESAEAEFQPAELGGALSHARPAKTTTKSRLTAPFLWLLLAVGFTTAAVCGVLIIFVTRVSRNEARVSSQAALDKAALPIASGSSQELLDETRAEKAGPSSIEPGAESEPAAKAASSDLSEPFAEEGGRARGTVVEPTGPAQTERFPGTAFPEKRGAEQQAQPWRLVPGLLIPMPAALTPDLAPEVAETFRSSFVQRENRFRGSLEDPEGTFSAFCSRCHILPPPDVEPRGLWPAKIRQMYRYASTVRPQPPEAIPPIEEAIEYWTSRAPSQMRLPPEAMDSPISSHRFRRRWVRVPQTKSPAVISWVKAVRWNGGAVPSVVISDMLHGDVVLWSPGADQGTSVLIGRTDHPCRGQIVDLDKDGLEDVLISNLGDFWPVDTDKGSVVWFRNRGGSFDPVTLISGLGRTSDVQAADFDGDDDLDLIVACFGNLETGGLIHLENLTTDWNEPQFDPVVLEAWPGNSDVPVVDLDGNGTWDFFTLQSQEKERIRIFLNRGWGSFQEHLVYQAPHPRWGSTGIVPVDLDSDGDLDLLFHHGDSFQFPPVARPYHGVSWLENQGQLPFAYHRLCAMPGAQTAIPGDLDGDGDLDVVIAALMPGFNPNWEGAERLDSVIWLEQVERGKFTRWRIEGMLPYHACGDVADLDGDGDLDIVLGNFIIFRFPQIPPDATLVIYENLMY